MLNSGSDEINNAPVGGRQLCFAQGFVRDSVVTNGTLMDGELVMMK